MTRKHIRSLNLAINALLVIFVLGIYSTLAYVAHAKKVRYTDVLLTKCAWCQESDPKVLNRHHILMQELFPSLIDDLDNIIVLCDDCHFVLGHRRNTKQCVPDVKEICDRYTNTLKISDRELPKIWDPRLPVDNVAIEEGPVYGRGSIRSM